MINIKKKARPTTNIYLGILFLTKNNFTSDQNRKKSERPIPSKTPNESERISGTVTNIIFKPGELVFKSKTFK